MVRRKNEMPPVFPSNPRPAAIPPASCPTPHPAFPPACHAIGNIGLARPHPGSPGQNVPPETSRRNQPNSHSKLSASPQRPPSAANLIPTPPVCLFRPIDRCCGPVVKPGTVLPEGVRLRRQRRSLIRKFSNSVRPPRPPASVVFPVDSTSSSPPIPAASPGKPPSSQGIYRRIFLSHPNQ